MSNSDMISFLSLTLSIFLGVLLVRSLGGGWGAELMVAGLIITSYIIGFIKGATWAENETQKIEQAVEKLFCSHKHYIIRPSKTGQDAFCVKCKQVFSSRPPI